MRLGWPLALCLSIGALAGAANAIYASVASRSAELLTLRAIGFSRWSVFAGTLTESAAVAAAGAIAGLIGGFFPALRAARRPLVAGRD